MYALITNYIQKGKHFQGSNRNIRLLRNLMTYYGINDNPARVLILSHMNLDHTPPSCFFTIQFNIVLHLRLGLPRSHTSVFPIKNVYTCFISPPDCHMVRK